MSEASNLGKFAGNFLAKEFARAERESWDEKTEINYVIAIPVSPRGAARMEVAEQTERHPRGFTKEMALKAAGRYGRVWRNTVISQRLK